MTKQDVLSISLKILGVVYITRAVLYVPMIGYFILPQGSVDSTRYRTLGLPSPGFTVILPFFLILVIGYILLKWGDSIARKLIRVDSEVPAFDAQWEMPAFTLALRVIGVFCLTRIISTLQSSFSWQPAEMDISYLVGIIAAAAYLLIGVYLIAGGKHLVKFAFRKQIVTQSK